MTSDDALTSARPRAGLAIAVGGVITAAGMALLGWPALAGGPGPAADVENTPVTALDLRSPTSETSPAVAVDPTNEDFAAAAVRRDAPGPGCALLVSGDGGDSWAPVDAIGALPEGVNGCHTPEVAFDSDGRLVFAFVGVAPGPPQPAGLFAVTSDDNAQTFTQPRQIAEVDTFAVSTAVHADGTVTAAWTRPGDEQDANGAGWPVGEALVAATGDHGGLDEPQVVADPDGLVAGPTVAFDNAGDATIAYYELPAGAAAEEGLGSLVGHDAWRLMAAHRPADAEDFAEPVEIAQVRLPGEPDTAESPLAVLAPRLVSQQGVAAPSLAATEGRVCAAWTHQPEGEALQALASCSPDGGEDWDEPARVATASDVADGWGEWLPQLAATSSGELETVFYRGPVDGDQVGVANVYRASGDPDDGFDEPQRLSARSSHAQLAPNRGWYGTRLGLAVGGERAVAMWADSRNSLPMYPGQTIFAATVATGAGQGVVPGWLAGGLLAGGLGLAVAGLWHRRARRMSPADVTGDAALEGTAR